MLSLTHLTLGNNNVGEENKKKKKRIANSTRVIIVSLRKPSILALCPLWELLLCFLQLQTASVCRALPQEVVMFPAGSDEPEDQRCQSLTLS